MTGMSSTVSRRRVVVVLADSAQVLGLVPPPAVAYFLGDGEHRRGRWREAQPRLIKVDNRGRAADCTSQHFTLSRRS